nr:unnamed protein product [uncultured bacterium]
MAKANLFKRPDHVAKLGRNVFDMSQTLGFTSSVGQLLPVFYDVLNPGDKISIKSLFVTKTQPMQSDNFAKVTENVDYFFVPFEQIYSLFGSFFYQIADFNSSLFSKKGGALDLTSTHLPLASFDGLSYELFSSQYDIYSDDDDHIIFPNNTLDEYGVPNYFNHLRLMQLFGMSNYFTSDASQPDQFKPSINLFLPLAYQKIFNDYYRLDDWTAPDPTSYNIDSSFDADIIRTSYYRSIFKLRYRPWKKDYYTNLSRNPYFNASYNADGAYGPNGMQSLSSLATALPYDTDSVKDNPLVENLGLSKPVGDESEAVTIKQGIPRSLPFYAGYDSPYLSQEQGIETLNVSQLRALYATDKLLRITQFAGKHYDAQTLAHFGKKVPQGVSGEVYYLGGQSQRLQISPITALSSGQTSDGSDTVFGEQGARAASVTQGQKPFTFEAPCHGILMAIYSAVPEANYSCDAIDRINTLAYSNDFYKPELDNIGMSPLYSYEFSVPGYTLFRNPPTPYSSDDAAQSLGWQFRYSWFKTKVDRTCGALNRTLRSWCPKRDYLALGLQSRPQLFNYASLYYVSPSYLDGLFYLNFAPPIDYRYPVDSDMSSIAFETDPLIHDMQITCYKTSVMSTYGLPNL